VDRENILIGHASYDRLKAVICHEEPRSAIIETSCQVGQVAVASGARVLAARRLDEARRHARDLIPALRDLLAEQGWKPRDLSAIVVSRGPGSYTGLRVGLMTAKTLAYALGCTLLGIDTFAAIARQAPEEARRVDVLADAQQGKVYVQSFVRTSSDIPGSALWCPQTDLAVQPFPTWLAALEQDVYVSGPGLRAHEGKIVDRPLVEQPLREPLPESLLQIGLERLKRGERDDYWSLEPLYLRPSAAEEKMHRA
jgi:tRNA threonylcarbamoyladenosine biosynthesis protein TsaB